MIAAGRLRHRIVLQQAVPGKDGAGSITQAWSDIDAVWAECLPLGGREQAAVQAKGSRATWRIVIRWRADISPRMRALYDGRVLNFTDIADLNGTRRGLRIEAEEIHVK